MTPTAPLSKTGTSNGLGQSRQSGLGFTDNIEAAFEQSTNGKVRAKIVPNRIIDVPFYAEVTVPTYGGTNIDNKQTFLEADLTRTALEMLMEDTGLKEIEVLGPAQTNGPPTDGGNGEQKQAGFFEQNWPWVLGGGAVVLVGAQLLARSGRRQMAQKAEQVQGSRANPDGPVDEAVETLQEGIEEASAETAEAVETGEETIEDLEEETEEALPESLEDRGNPSDSNNSADYWIARATVDQDEMDRGNVHRTSMAANIASLDMEDQRRIASNLAVAPGGKVTVWKNTADGLKQKKTFTWNPDSGFSPTS